MSSKRDGDQPARRPLVDDQLADDLLRKAQAEGVELLAQTAIYGRRLTIIYESGRPWTSMVHRQAEVRHESAC